MNHFIQIGLLKILTEILHDQFLKKSCFLCKNASKICKIRLIQMILKILSLVIRSTFSEAIL